MAGGVPWKEPDVERLKDAVAKTPKDVKGGYWIAIAARFNKTDANGRNGPIVECTARQVGTNCSPASSFVNRQ
jgi:hypothetical protein